VIIAKSSFKYIPGYYVSEYHRYFQGNEKFIPKLCLFFVFSSCIHISNFILIEILTRIMGPQLELFFVNVHGFQEYVIGHTFNKFSILHGSCSFEEVWTFLATPCSQYFSYSVQTKFTKVQISLTGT
jgi:hypothetical protein